MHYETQDLSSSPSVLLHRPFVVLLCARAATYMAFQMLGVAVGWQIYAITGSAMYLGLVGLAQFLLMFLLTLVVGHVADRYDRRNIARICQTIEGLSAGVLALLPVYARDILVTGPWGLGLLRSAPAVGALMMSVYLARRPLRRRVGRSMFRAVAVFGAATILFAVSTSFLLSFSLLVILGASDVISVVIRHSLVQIRTPDEMRGRVSAVNSMFIGASNQLGEFESGVTAALFGTVPAVLIGGIGTIFVVMLWIRVFPQLAGVDTLDQ